MNPAPTHSDNKHPASAVTDVPCTGPVTKEGNSPLTPLQNIQSKNVMTPKEQERPQTFDEWLRSPDDQVNLREAIPRELRQLGEAISWCFFSEKWNKDKNDNDSDDEIQFLAGW